MFIGYLSMKKGYKWFDPQSRKLYVTMDVIFHENEPYFSYHLSGESIYEGERLGNGDKFGNDFGEIQTIQTIRLPQILPE